MISVEKIISCTEKVSFSKWIQIGVFSELFILIWCYFNYSESGDIFRYAARFSGRISLVIYLYGFYSYAANYSDLSDQILEKIRKTVLIFCILHMIHFGFLAMSVYLNNMNMVPVKLAGGFIAYLMIIIYPWIIKKYAAKKLLHTIYFYYVGLVMALTYVARLSGGVDGRTPSVPFHYVGLVIMIITFSYYTYLIFTGIAKWKLFSK